jgi:hypothetical protein
MERGLSRARSRSEASALLQGGLQIGSHGGAHVAVDAVHAGHLVAHPLGLQDLGDAVLVHPGLEAVAQAVRCQAPEHGQPGGHGQVLGGLPPGAEARTAAALSMRDQRGVLTPGPRPATSRAATSALVTDQANHPTPGRRHEFLTRHGWWPGSYRPPWKSVTVGHEDRRGQS